MEMRLFARSRWQCRQTRQFVASLSKNEPTKKSGFRRLSSGKTFNHIERIAPAFEIFWAGSKRPWGRKNCLPRNGLPASGVRCWSSVPQDAYLDDEEDQFEALNMLDDAESADQGGDTDLDELVIDVEDQLSRYQESECLAYELQGKIKRHFNPEQYNLCTSNLVKFAKSRGIERDRYSLFSAISELESETAPQLPDLIQRYISGRVTHAEDLRDLPDFEKAFCRSYRENPLQGDIDAQAVLLAACHRLYNGRIRVDLPEPMVLLLIKSIKANVVEDIRDINVPEHTIDVAGLLHEDYGQLERAQGDLTDVDINRAKELILECISGVSRENHVALLEAMRSFWGEEARSKMDMARFIKGIRRSLREDRLLTAAIENFVVHGTSLHNTCQMEEHRSSYLRRLSHKATIIRVLIDCRDLYTAGIPNMAEEAFVTSDERSSESKTDLTDEQVLQDNGASIAQEVKEALIEIVGFLNDVEYRTFYQGLMRYKLSFEDAEAARERFLNIVRELTEADGDHIAELVDKHLDHFTIEGLVAIKTRKSLDAQRDVVWSARRKAKEVVKSRLPEFYARQKEAQELHFDELERQRKKVFLWNLPHLVTEEQLQNYFSRFGEIEFIQICREQELPWEAPQLQQLLQKIGKQKRVHPSFRRDLDRLQSQVSTGRGKFTKPKHLTTGVYGFITYVEEDGAAQALTPDLRTFGMVMPGRYEKDGAVMERSVCLPMFASQLKSLRVTVNNGTLMPKSIRQKLEGMLGHDFEVDFPKSVRSSMFKRSFLVSFSSHSQAEEALSRLKAAGEAEDFTVGWNIRVINGKLS